MQVSGFKYVGSIVVANTAFITLHIVHMCVSSLPGSVIVKHGGDLGSNAQPPTVVLTGTFAKMPMFCF